MKLPKPSEDSGLTIIELIIVVGLLAIVLAIGLPASIDFYLSYQLVSEARLLSSLLSQARNLAMTNYNEADHGVYVDTADFVLFEGPGFAGRNTSQDRVYPRTAAITATGTTEFVFRALSGRTSSTTVTLSDERRSKSIGINEEGRLDY